MKNTLVILLEAQVIFVGRMKPHLEDHLVLVNGQ